MTNEELRAKYARIPADFSEIEMLKDQLLDSGLLEVAQANNENAGKMVGFDESGKLEAKEVEQVIGFDGEIELIATGAGHITIPANSITKSGIYKLSGESRGILVAKYAGGSYHLMTLLEGQIRYSLNVDTSVNVVVGDLSLCNGTKLYKHELSTWPSVGTNYPIISTESTSFNMNTTAVEGYINRAVNKGVVGIAGNGYPVIGVFDDSANGSVLLIYLKKDGTTASVSLTIDGSTTDTVTPL